MCDVRSFVCGVCGCACLFVCSVFVLSFVCVVECVVVCVLVCVCLSECVSSCVCIVCLWLLVVVVWARVCVFGLCVCA